MVYDFVVMFVLVWGMDGGMRLDDGLVEKEGFADVFDFGDCAFEVEGFGEDDFEDLERVLC